MDSFSLTLRTKGEVDRYPSKSHARQVAQKLGLPDSVILLIGSRSYAYSHSDRPVPFRQDGYFHYLTGCAEPDCYATYDIAKDWLTLWLPPIHPQRVWFDGSGITVEEALERYDIDEARVAEDYVPLIMIFRTLRPESGRFLVVERPPAPSIVLDSLPYDQSTLRPAMDACRAVKDEHEIALIRKANEISAEAHRNVVLQLHTCKSEAEAEAIYMQTCIARMAKEQAYEPIFGSGPNASTLHYVRNTDRLANRQLLLVDAGCQWRGYASDVTRTIPLNPKNPGHWPSREAQQVYEAVQKIQETCIRHMTPSRKFSHVAWLAQHLSIDALLELGILKGNHMDIFRAGTDRAFFPHGLGHHLGLEVHDVQPPFHSTNRPDVPDTMGRAYCAFAQEFPSYQLDEETCLSAQFEMLLRPLHCIFPDSVGDPPMEPGNVITVEPGLYFNEGMLNKVILPDPLHRKFIDTEVLKRFMPVGGVRIEDDILITEDGNENLTTAPKGEEMLQLLQRHKLDIAAYM